MYGSLVLALIVSVVSSSPAAKQLTPNFHFKMSRGESSLPDEYQAAIALEVNKAMTSSQNDLVSSMKAMMDSNFESFLSSMEATQKELSTTQISKMEESLLGAHKFKRQGNEAQYRGNAKVLSKLHEADEALNSRDITMLTISTARERITEGITLLDERQKLIKIADSSPLGWKVVNEYQANPIADNSDDEKDRESSVTRGEEGQGSEAWSRRTELLASIQSHPV